MPYICVYCNVVCVIQYVGKFIVIFRSCEGRWLIIRQPSIWITWDNFGFTVGSYWNLFGVTLGSLWYHCVITSVLFLDHFGITFAVFLHNVGVILAIWPTNRPPNSPASQSVIRPAAGLASLRDKPLARGLASQSANCLASVWASWPVVRPIGWRAGRPAGQPVGQ